jgi:hypothetical protein
VAVFPEARAQARKAVGAELLARCETLLRPRRLGQASESTQEAAIPLHWANSLNDCRVRWWMGVVDPVLSGVVELGQLDHHDPKQIGQHLRRLVRNFVDAAERALDLELFLLEFEQDASAAGLLAAHIRAFIDFGACQLVAMTTVEDEDAERAAARTEEAAARLLEAEEIKEEALGRDVAPPSPEELIATLIGETPRWQSGQIGELWSAFGPDKRRHAALATRQLRLLVREEDVADEFATTWLTLACRIGSEAFPLLAHRSALLTWRTLFAAFAADADAAGSLLAGFYVAQAARIVSAGRKGDEDLMKYRNGDDERLIEAYRTLSEGILRPFGGLALHIGAVARGASRPQLGPRPLLGELEDSLIATGTELAALLAFGIARPLRNAGAHLDIVRGASGQLSIAAEDGSLLAVDLHALDRDYSTLRSALTGVDVACGLGFRQLVPEQKREMLSRATTTDAVLELFATFAAAEIVQGFVTDLVARGELLTFTLHGNSTPDEAAVLVNRLEPHLHDATRTVVVLDPDGQLIVECQRGS